MDQKQDKTYPGLDGLYVAETSISKVDPSGKLIYGGQDVSYYIEDLIQRSFEDVVFLLLRGKLPSPEESQDFAEDLARRRSLSKRFLRVLDSLTPEVEDGLKAEPDTNKSMDYMDAIRTSFSALSLDMRTSYPPDEDQILNCIAKLPSIIGRYHRAQTGQPLLEPDLSLSHIAHYYYQITGQKPNEGNQLAIRALEIYSIIAMEHGLNASTFVVRATNSTEPDLITSITAGMCALKGPKHGGATVTVGKMFRNIGKIENAETYLVQEYINKGQLIPGRGHRIYQKVDPRTPIMMTVLSWFSPDKYPAIAFSTQLEEIITHVLKTHKSHTKPLCTNLDYYTATLFNVIGFPIELYETTFLNARIVGYGVHAREGSKNNRLMRPDALFKGPTPEPTPKASLTVKPEQTLSYVLGHCLWETEEKNSVAGVTAVNYHPGSENSLT